MATACETSVRKRNGLWAPPLVDGPLDIDAILADLERREVIPLPELGRMIGMGEQARARAITAGLIEPLPKETRRGPNSVSRDEAITLLLAAVLALAAGICITAVLRGTKGAGLTGAAAAATLAAMPR